MRPLVVITCYHAVELTIDCLRSLEPEIRSCPGARVGICENGSGAEAAARLRSAIEANGWAEWVYVKAIHPNRGFTGGNNVILSDAMSWPEPPDCFLLLNSDTIVRPGALRTLLEALASRPDVGIVGPRLEYPDGEPQVSCFRLPSPLSELIRGACTGPVTRMLKGFDVPLPPAAAPIEPDWVSFACALIRWEVVAQVGLLDEGFYLYFDDPDYCRRTRQAGWNILYCPQARVVHLIGRSNPVETLTAERKRRPRYYYASRARYLGKYYGRSGLYLANLMWTLGRGLALARELVGSKRRHTCDREWRDIWTNALEPVGMAATPTTRGSELEAPATTL